MAVLAPSSLERVREKVQADERLDFEDGLALMESDDVLELGALADEARRRRGGTDEVYFVQNLYLNQTNVCRVKCKFCAFAVTQKQEGAYTYSPEELVEDARGGGLLAAQHLLRLCVTEARRPAAQGRQVRAPVRHVHHHQVPRQSVRSGRLGGPRPVGPRQLEREKALLRGFRRLGCWPLRRIRPGHGASIHYGGTIPMTREERELTVTPSSRLRGTKGVYLADGSVLPYLPAKAPTLTLMANAERVGTVVLRELEQRLLAAA